MRDVMIRATKEQIRDFMSSILWKDMKRELGLWKTMAKNEYGQVVGDVIAGKSEMVNSDMHLGSLYGREATINFLLGLPGMFLQIIEDQIEEKEDDD